VFEVIVISRLKPWQKAERLANIPSYRESRDLLQVHSREQARLFSNFSQFFLKMGLKFKGIFADLKTG
jgi:hypothetical protein